MDKFINNELIYSVVNHHIGHFFNVRKLVKHDYESHMILLTAYSHFLFQTMSKGRSLDWERAKGGYYIWGIEDNIAAR